MIAARSAVVTPLSRVRSVLIFASCLFTVATAHAQSHLSAAGGANHTLVLKSDGTVWAFGDNSYGQLGDSSTILRSTPVQASGITDIIAVAAGGNHSMALTSTGSVYVWGLNASGQLGTASTTDSNVPVQSSLTGRYSRHRFVRSYCA